MIINKKIIAAISPLPVIILLIANTFYPTIVEMVRAETGTSNDIFKVILTIIGTNKADTGDVVAVVTVNDHSRVKFFNVLSNGAAADDSLSEGDTSNSSSDSTDQGRLIEYVATFPNVTVNTGDGYKACALPLKTLKIICKDGNNSPAKRPEFVDLSLGSTGSDKSQSSSDSFTTNQSAMISSSDETNNNPDDEKHKKKNDDKLTNSANSENDGTAPFIPQ